MNYGKKCHLFDIDCVGGWWVEHTTGKVFALSEWKQDYERTDLNSSAIKALIWLADNSQIPAFLIFGYEKQRCYYVRPLNSYALRVITEPQGRFMSESTYCQFLHHIRGKTPVAPGTLDGLSTEVPANLYLPNIV